MAEAGCKQFLTTDRLAMDYESFSCMLVYTNACTVMLAWNLANVLNVFRDFMCHRLQLCLIQPLSFSTAAQFPVPFVSRQTAEHLSFICSLWGKGIVLDLGHLGFLRLFPSSVSTQAIHREAAIANSGYQEHPTHARPQATCHPSYRIIRT